MAAPFRANDDFARLPSSTSATLASIAHHHRAIQDLIEDLERVRLSGADLWAFEGRIGAASDFAAQNGRQLNALLTGDTGAVKLADLSFLKQYAPSPVRQAAE